MKRATTPKATLVRFAFVCATLIAADTSAQDAAVPKTHVLAVMGSVRNANGAALNGWTVTVTNSTRGWSYEAVTGSTGRHGVYAILHVDSVNPAAEVGDHLALTATGPGGVSPTRSAVEVTKRQIERAAVTVPVTVADRFSRLSIVTPERDAQLPAGTPSVRLTVEMGDHVTGWAWRLDEPLPESASIVGTRVATGDTTTVTGLRDRTTHVIHVALTDENGDMLNPAVTTRVEVSVGAAPRLSIVSPMPEEVFPAGVTSVPLVVEIVNPAAGWHWQLDAPLPEADPLGGGPGGNGPVVGDRVLLTGLTDGQVVTAYVTLVDELGNALPKPVSASVRFFVAPAAPIARILANGEDVESITHATSGLLPPRRFRLTLDGSTSSDADGVIVRYDWDFGDGERAQGPVVSHEFLNEPPRADVSFTVTLTVTDEDGIIGTDTLRVRIRAGGVQRPPPPIVPTIAVGRDDPLELNALERTLDDISFQDPLVAVGEPLSFDGSRSSARFGEIVEYEWDFGDNSVASGDRNTHQFDAPGVQFVTLTVMSDGGVIGSTSFALVVVPSITIIAAVGGTDGDAFSLDGGDELIVDLTATSAVPSGPMRIAASLGELASFAEFSTREESATVARATLRLRPAVDSARDEPYAVTISATNELESPTIQLSFTIRRGNPWDLNDDGVVDIVDLVLVARAFGQVGVETGDVDENGEVNIVDLVLVAAHFGESGIAAAPKMPGQTHRSAVRNWLRQARNAARPSREYREGLAALERLAADSPPYETALLPNYPNPFNPDTWIPFALAEESEITIMIYEMKGQVVIRLELGRLQEGAYVTRERAAYWDGRDQFGERVASGVYVYELRAGPSVKRRRMVIVK